MRWVLGCSQEQGRGQETPTPAFGLNSEPPECQHTGLGSEALPSLLLRVPHALGDELTTWFKVMTRRRVSLQLFTRPSGKQGSRSFSRVSMCSMVVASLEPGRRKAAETPAHCLQLAPAPPHPLPRRCPTSGLLDLLDAELGGRNGSRVMGRGLFTKHELAALEDGAHPMLGSLPDLRGKKRGQGRVSTQPATWVVVTTTSSEQQSHTHAGGILCVDSRADK